MSVLITILSLLALVIVTAPIDAKADEARYRMKSDAGQVEATKPRSSWISSTL